ncbi:hypothetical protein TcasGA2_TC008740 [Tribolium castaneum]|uniref:Uncharacterized protein n=1 Tax=Tribolium castaneum TaxID=7070 RepID=D6WS72_TRICA|nr:hypothetical protein TcasGA2_TC008740 [Tribolium castaneum]
MPRFSARLTLQSKKFDDRSLESPKMCTFTTDHWRLQRAIKRKTRNNSHQSYLIIADIKSLLATISKFTALRRLRDCFDAVPARDVNAKKQRRGGEASN